MIDEALPPKLFELLAERLVVRYERPYHRNGYWFELGSQPRILVEHAIAHLTRHLPTLKGVHGVEWWSLAREPAQGFGIHHDGDPARQLARPRFGSILYLGNAGGPTLVFEQTTSPDGKRLVPAQARAAVAFPPAPNRFALFRGDLKHSVAAVDQPPEPKRVTLLMNWWFTRPKCHDVPYDAPAMRALMPPPESRWPDESAARAVSAIALSADELAALPERPEADSYGKVLIWPRRAQD
jgi:hypothetical protein